MPTQNRIISSTAAFDFLTNPIEKQVLTGSFNTTYSVTGQGAAIGTSGYRIWNGASSGSAVITPQNPWKAPLSSANLPSILFDAIILLNLDGEEIPLAFSNSQDNDTGNTGNTLISNDNLFWTNLIRSRAGNEVETSQSPQYYFFGGDFFNFNVLPSGLVNVLKLNLLYPVVSNTVFSYVMTFFDINDDNAAFSKNGSVTVTPAMGSRNIALGDFPIELDVNSYGWLKISVTCNNPTYRSLLPFYHWGVKTL